MLFLNLNILFSFTVETQVGLGLINSKHNITDFKNETAKSVAVWGNVSDTHDTFNSLA